LPLGKEALGLLKKEESVRHGGSIGGAVGDRGNYRLECW
jgi:hypothetical protein